MPKYLVVFQNVLKEKLQATAYVDDSTVTKGSVVTIIGGNTGLGKTGKVFGFIDGFYKTGPRTGIPMRKFGVALSDVTIPYTDPKTGRTYDRHVDAEWVWARNLQKKTILVNKIDPFQFVQEAKERYERQ